MADDISNHTVSRRDEPYLAYSPPPDIVTDEMLIAVVQGVTAAFTAITAAKRKQNKTDAASDTLKPNNR